MKLNRSEEQIQNFTFKFIFGLLVSWPLIAQTTIEMEEFNDVWEEVRVKVSAQAYRRAVPFNAL